MHWKYVQQNKLLSIFLVIKNNIFESCSSSSSRFHVFHYFSYISYRVFDIVTDVVLCDFVAENESPSEAYQDLVFD